MKKKIASVGIAILFVLQACNSQQDAALKSADKDFILKVANDNFEKKKYAEAIELYDRLASLVAFTDDAANVVFRTAYANYYEKNYRLAGHQFKKFTVSFPLDPRVEEAAYMSALCYYEGSMDYKLDQVNTLSAIEELQSFIDAYPNSERSKNINSLITELYDKLELKAYSNAKQYYDIAQYKAATVALQGVLDEYPSTKLRPKIIEYLLRSKYELAVNSRYDLKEERLKLAESYAQEVARGKYPENVVLAQKLLPKIETEKEKFKIDKALYEEEVKKLEAKNEKNLKLKDQKVLSKFSKEIQGAQQNLRDSASAVQPEDAIKIKL